MSHKQILKKLIIDNNSQEFQSYYIFNNLKVKEVNDTTFDLLNFAIEHGANDTLIQFIITQYTHCDYETPDQQIPLYMALANHRWTIALTLINQRKANINRQHSNGDNILIFLCKTGQLTRLNLKFALDHHVNINVKDSLGKKILYYLIHNNYSDMVEYVLTYYIYDTPFILNLLQHGRSNKSLSNEQLQTLLNQETQKIDITSSFYFSAIKTGNLDIVKHLYINDGHTATQNIIQQYDMLIRSTINGKVPLVQYFLELGADVNKSNYKGDTALMIAALKGYLPIVQLLLKYGAQVNLSNKRNYTALIYASEKNHYEIVEVLLKHGASINQPEKDGNTPLILASLFGNEKTVRLLLERGADFHIKNYHGWSAIHSAMLFPHLNIVKVLVEHGLPLDDATHDKGITALHIAAESGNEEAVNYLLEQGADKNKASHTGKTALMLAAANDRLGMVRILVQHGVDLEATDEKGDTALMHATNNGLLEVVKYLVEEAGAQLSVRNSKEATPAIYAASNEHLEVLNYLLSQGADVEGQDCEGWNPLLIATQCNHLGMMTSLLEHGVNLDQQENEGRSSLMIAAENNSLEAVKLLIEHGCSLTLQDHHGHTACSIAAYHGHKEMVEYLLEAHTNVGDRQRDLVQSYIVAMVKGSQTVLNYLSYYLYKHNIKF